MAFVTETKQLLGNWLSGPYLTLLIGKLQEFSVVGGGKVEPGWRCFQLRIPQRQAQMCV